MLTEAWLRCPWVDNEWHIWWWIFFFFPVPYSQHCPLLKGYNVHLRLVSHSTILSSQGRGWQKNSSECDGENLVQPINLDTRCTEWRAIFCLQPKKAAPHLWHSAINQARVCKIQFATAEARCITIDNLMEAWSTNVNFWVPLRFIFAKVMCEAFPRDP